MLRLVSVVALFSLLSTAFAEWHRFRGPNGSGVAKGSFPVKVTESDFAWKVALPDEGHGSPVVWKDAVYVTAGNPKTAERTLLCIDAASGKTKWSQKFPSRNYHLHKFNHYGTTTPAVDADRVYTYWVTDKQVNLAAFTHAGAEEWRIDIGPFSSSHGGGTSPILFQDLLIITNDQVGESFLLAVDKETGKERWKLPRRNTANGTAYSVPCLYEEPGQKPQLILTSKANGMTGVDPASGEVLWEISDLFPLRVVFSTVVAVDLVVSGCGQGGGGKRLVAVRPGSADGKRKPELVWEGRKALPYVPAPVVVGEWLFTLNDSTGVASCYEAATGKVLWQERLEGQQFFGSPISAGGNIYAISKAGNLVAFKAGPSFALLGVSPLGELSYATPAVSGGRMFLRTLKHLVCISAN